MESFSFCINLYLDELIESHTVVVRQVFENYVDRLSLYMLLFRM